MNKSRKDTKGWVQLWLPFPEDDGDDNDAFPEAEPGTVVREDMTPAEMRDAADYASRAVLPG